LLPFRSPRAGLTVLGALATILFTAFAAEPCRSAAPRGAVAVEATAESPPAKPRRIWSVAIGVSDYLHSSKGISDLQYAAADARAFDQMVAGAQFAGSGVPADQRLLLVDKDAHLAAVRGALLEFLGRAGKDDLVVVLFAGHGAPDPLRPDELYLLVADTDPERLASTALPMVEVQRAFERLRSDHVVFFADACHSAGILLPGKQLRALDGGNPIHRELASLGKVQRNRVVVTSSGADEKSFEGKKWQHGVFTWALLQAVAGAADANGNRDGIVQLGEAISHVRDAVERETGFAQHPAVIGQIDERLPLAVVGTGGQGAPKAVPPAAAKALQPRKGKPAPPVKRAMVHFDFEDQHIEPRRWRPDAFFVLPGRRLEGEIPAEELARLSAPTAAALQAWRQVHGEVQRGTMARSATVRARTDCQERYQKQFALPDKATDADKLAFAQDMQQVCAAPIRADKDQQSKLDATLARELAATHALRDRLAGDLDRDASPVSGLPPALWVVLADAEARLAQATWTDAYDAWAKSAESRKQGPEPQRQYRKAIAIYDAFLDRYRVHPWRPTALYQRAWLTSEQDGVGPLDIAQHYLRVLAEVPDHADAVEINLRIGLAYFDSLDPKVQTLARAVLAAAIERAPPGHKMRNIVIYMAVWVALAMDRRDEAQALALTLLREDAAEQDRERRSPVARELAQVVASIAFEDGTAHGVEQAALPADVKAEILGEAAVLSREAGDFELGLQFARSALQLNSDHRRAESWDSTVALCLVSLRRYGEAADVFEARFVRFGPASAWYGRHRERLGPKFLEELTSSVQRAAPLRDAAAAAAKTAPLPPTPRELFLPLPHRLGWMFGLCYGEALRGGRNPRGKVVLRLTFFQDAGLQAAQIVSDTTPDPVLCACILRRVQAMRNPPRADAVLTIPLLFTRDP